MKDLPLYDLNEIRQERSRRSFFDFVKFTKQDFIEGWFNRLVAEALQRFYEDVKAGKQPRLMIFAPPRSGKSELFSRRFPAWALGKDPDLQIIATSYSSDLSSRMNRDVQRIIDDSLYESVFPDTSLNSKNIVTVSGMSLRNSEIFEVVGKKGAIQNITGTITNGACVDATSGVFSNNGTSRGGTAALGGGGGRVITFDASTVVRTADEVRVKNIAYPVYIKII